MSNIFENLKVITTSEAKNYNPQVLAFVGDGVYTLYVRSMLATTKDVKSGKLHTLANEYVNAVSQSNVLEKVKPYLNEEELAVFKRARNYKTQSIAKSATVLEYKRATGLEGVIGYLYLTGQNERLNYILSLCVQGGNNES